MSISSPVLEQRSFLNACLRIRARHQPEELLDLCKGVERALGRDLGGPRHGPRLIDVDILLLDGVVHRSERLRIPHPELLRRRFVLVPLLELAPELTAPPDDISIADALADVREHQWVRSCGPRLLARR